LRPLFQDLASSYLRSSFWSPQFQMEMLSWTPVNHRPLDQLRYFLLGAVNHQQPYYFPCLGVGGREDFRQIENLFFKLGKA
jgi:hypothetical protein